MHVKKELEEWSLQNWTQNSGHKAPNLTSKWMGSIGEVFTSLELNFTKEKDFHGCMVWSYGDVHDISNTYNETKREEEERGKEGFRAHIPKD